MPFIGRGPRYPIYPEFGADPNKFKNTLSFLYENDLFLIGSTINIQVKTGNSDVRLYDQAIEFFNGEIDFTIIEDATCTDGTTPIAIGNPDRNSAFISSVTAYSDPTGISGGTIVAGMEHFGLPSPVFGLGDVPPTILNYLSLKHNSNYIIRFENVGTEDIIDFRYIMLWSE